LFYFYLLYNIYFQLIKYLLNVIKLEKY